MTNFRTYSQAATMRSACVNNSNPLHQLSEDEEIQCTCILFMVLYSDSFAIARTIEGIDTIRKSPDFYKGRFKAAIDSLLCSVRKFERKLNKDIRETMGVKSFDNLALLNDSIDEQVMGRYESLRTAILEVFRDEHHLEHAEELSWVFAFDTAITIACEVKGDAEYSAPFLKGKIGFLDMHVLYESSTRMCQQAAARIPESVKINLSKQLTVMSKKQAIRKALENVDVFVKAFQDGSFTLN